MLSANKWSIFQLLDAMRLNDKRTVNSYKTAAKTYAAIDKKYVVPLYAEHLNFLIDMGGNCKRYGYSTLLNKVNLKKNLSLWTKYLDKMLKQM